MENPIKLLDNIIKNMEYIELLLTEGHKYVAPLNTFNLVMKRLNRLRVILDTEYLTPEQIREAVIRLEKPIKREKPYYVEVENPVESGDPIKEGTVINYETIKNGIRFLSKYNNPFYRDSVGTEELHEDTR